jgi:hypothetical protein
MLRSRVTALLIALAVLTSCSQPESFYVVNRSGAALEIISSSFTATMPDGTTHKDNWGRWEPWPMVIRDGVSRKVQIGGFGVWTIRMRVLAFTIMNDVQSGTPNPVQIEPDGQLYVAPGLDWARPASTIEQPEAFPLQPTQRRCPI